MHPESYRSNESDMMLSTLISRLSDSTLLGTNVIPWGSPVPCFGDLACANTATLGLNPSNREFVDEEGKELDGPLRRFHTLRSLGLQSWAEAKDVHLETIMDSCRKYFSRNPYDGWFRRLDHIISAANASYYGGSPTACHLDLIPYATSCKWTELSREQRSGLLGVAGDTLGLLLRNSQIELLVLNGNSVVAQFEEMSSIRLQKRAMSKWALPRRSNGGVKGFAYMGYVTNVSGIELGREILVLGFNHNIQSSFGVTKQVIEAIRLWIAESAEKIFS